MAVTINIEIPLMPKFIAEMEKSPGVIRKKIDEAIYDSINKIYGKINPGYVPNRTGRLISSFRTKFSSLYGEVYTNLKYASYVHEGTRPHVIRIKTAKVLANKREGKIFGRKVNHPGTMPNPFLKRIVDLSRGEIDKTFQKKLDEAMNDIASKVK
jgi:hypothetical protein